MEQGNRIITIAAVLILFLILQALFIIADRTNSPGKIAVNFTQAYYDLDPSMAKYLCSELTEEGRNPVDDYIWRKRQEAQVRGFDFDYMRFRLFSVHSEMVELSDSKATVRIIGEARRNINPVYTLVARLFFIGQSHEVDKTLKLIRENGRWKICGDPFSSTVYPEVA